MGRVSIRSQASVFALVAGCIGVITGCGSRQPPVEVSADANAANAALPAVQPLAVNNQTWTAEAMEALLAPIALYPDPVLSQVLMAATNPQEVLDAGNWLIDNPALADKALDQAATKAGFTPPVRALMQFRQIVDQMCLKMGWTTELGQAFTNDQRGVLAAVQRLRRQAQDAGNLENSPQMTVETQDQGGESAIVISPPSRQVVYVPQYDPTSAYAPPPAIDDSGYDSGDAVSSGELEYGAGLIVGNVFDHYADDYYHHHYYYPNYGHGRYPACPPRHYRPVYGHGHRPGHYYNRPPHYEDTLHDHAVLVVNHRGDDYWSNFDDRSTGTLRASSVPSPISVARMNHAQSVEITDDESEPARRDEELRSMPRRVSGYPGQPPGMGDPGQWVYAHDRGTSHHDEPQAARLQGGSSEQAAYDGTRQNRPHAGGWEPQTDVGDRQPPAYAGAKRQQFQAGGHAEGQGSVEPRQASQPNASFVTLGPRPPPQPAGARGAAMSGGNDRGAGHVAGPHAREGAAPARLGNSGVATQLPQR